MRLNGTDRIITEDDIVLLHGDYPTLSDALNQQKEDISIDYENTTFNKSTEK